MIITFDRLVEILDSSPDLPNQGVPARQALAIKFQSIGPGAVKNVAQYDGEHASLHIDLDGEGTLLGIEII
jgi:hypothetical protein